MDNKKYVITINSENGLVVANFRERFSIEDIIDFLEELYSNKNFDPHFISIYDFTACVGFQFDVVDIIEKLSNSVRKSKKGRIGVIVRNINKRYLNKGLFKKVKKLSFEVGIFNNKIECVYWITENFEKRIVIQSILKTNSMFFSDSIKD